jgi:cyclophilin family peptidyl-prolyl cis-trans isomerase
MRRGLLPLIIGIVVVLGIMTGAIYFQAHRNNEQMPDSTAAASPASLVSPSPETEPSPLVSASPVPLPIAQSNTSPDLSVDANGLSKATVVVTTNKGVIRFKFYPNDAPNTVHRIIELINQGFYNGLTFHRVVPGFVIQGGDPKGNGTGGSGQKIKAEFNDRRHLEGTVAMARAADPDSADSQFYITLSPQPHLDHNYTVFGQVVEGMDVVRKIEVGDKMLSLVINEPESSRSVLSASRHRSISHGGGGTKCALLGRVPPIQFCEFRNCPGCFEAPRTPRISLLCISLMSLRERGSPLAVLS